MEMEQLMKWMAEQQTQNQKVQPQMQQQQKEFQTSLVHRLLKKSEEQAAMAQGGSTIPETFTSSLTKMGPEDDPETYLITFERLATMAQWVKGTWAVRIAPFLTGEAQAAYHALGRGTTRTMIN
ncbi:hypothetical protein FKM82_001362 [Ascaphus truei]